ncbi:MAG: N-acetylglucosamine-6-phosphate deacetylase [Solirubrobacteraceae bacterium]
MRLGVRHALVGDVLIHGDVRVEHGRIAAVGVVPAGPTGLAAPGFVDLQVNGFGGVDFLAAEPPDYRTAGAALAGTGVTAYLPTFITSPDGADDRAVAVAAAAAAAARSGPRMLGVHPAGPFLSPHWPGAHDPRQLRAPNPALIERLAGAGPVALVTLAPELVGALELIEALVARGIVVSCGHSDADAHVAHAAFDAGARAVTHLHNAHRRYAHRDPGLGGVALVRPQVTVQVIVDNVHLAPEVAYAAFLCARERFCLVTDAMAAAGLGDGRYRLGSRDVQVEGMSARLADGTFAGSVLTMDAAVRNLVALGATEAQALLAATRAPARLLARADLGALTPGLPADVVVLDDGLEVRATLIGGHEAYRA